MKKTIFMWLMGLCAMGALSASAQTAASAIDGKKQTLFSSVNHASKPYRIPAVATLNNGTVLAVADQRPCGADVGNGEVDIYAKVGTIASNGTYTWNPATTDPSANGGLKIADGTDSNGYGDASVVVDRESGKVLVICVAGNVVFSKGTKTSHNKMARIVGSADGLTWESPEDVTNQFFANELSGAYTMFMASGKMVQSQIVKVGDYYRIYGALLVRDGDNTNYKNYVVYTDDFGEKWTVLGGKYAVSNADEAKVEELPNGDIVLSSRTEGGRNFNVFKFNNLDNATGYWGSATKYSFAGSNSTNGEIMLYKGLVDSNGTEYNVMLQSLPTGEKTSGFLGLGAKSGREKLSVYYKAFATNKTSWSVSDFTSGWTKGIEVDNGASAYSTMTVLPNGEIGFLYEDDYDTDKADGDYSNIVYVPLTVEEITGGAYTYVPESTEPQTPTVAAPIITPNGGNIFNTQEITLNCTTEGAFVYYTIDGTEPSVNSTLYTQPFTLSESATVKAIAVKEGYNDSKVTNVTFNVTKAYRFKNVQKNGTCYYFTYDADNGIGLTTDVEEAALYARGEGTTAGTYTYQTIDGNYLIFSGRDVNGQSCNKGYNDGKGFLTVYESAKCDLTVEPFEGTYYAISGQRDYKKNSFSSTKQEQAYFVITNEGKFDATTEPYYTDDFSSAFLIEEININNEPEAKKVATPVFSLPSGAYEVGTELSVTCATDGAKIYATLDASWPAEEWIDVTGQVIPLYQDITIYAIAKLEGWDDSDMTSAEYTVILPTVPTPVINPNGGKIESGDKITITCSDANANIYFTIDGTEPTENSIVYKSGFTLDADAIVKAIAVRNGFANSEVAVAEFTVNEINEVAVNFEKGYYNGFASYMSTFSAPFDVTVPSSIKVYIVKRATSTNANLTRLYNTNIPANTGVVLQTSKAGEVIIPEAKEGVTLANVSGNILIPTADGEVVLDSYAYVFGKNSSNKYAFYQTGAGEVVPQYRAYFVLNTAKAYVLELFFDDEENDPTAIEDVDVDEDVLNQESVIYDLTGRKVNSTRPGQIYIKNGKKFLAK